VRLKRAGARATACEFPNNYVGDLVPNERGWVVVPPTCCPDSHAYGDPGWSVSAVWCTCSGQYMACQMVVATSDTSVIARQRVSQLLPAVKRVKYQALAPLTRPFGLPKIAIERMNEE
jgi:hypothetical protein